MLLLAAFGAGALNAVAGGGTFLTLPALIFSGIPPVAANATSALVVFPGYITSALGFGDELRALPRRDFVMMLGLAVAGGVLGALLLLVTPDAAFRLVAPWLLLLATGLFAFGPLISKMVTQGGSAEGGQRVIPVLTVTTYGGYFNGGLGIMLLALYSGMGYRDLNQMNGMKNATSVILSLSSVVTFILAGLVVWKVAIFMMIAAASGGFAGARAARYIPSHVLRPSVVIIGICMALALF